MSWGDLGAVATVLGALVAVLTLYITTRNGVRERADKQRAREAQLFEDGKASRDDEVALLRSQRDDARRERDRQTARADEMERRYNDLRDRRAPDAAT